MLLALYWNYEILITGFIVSAYEWLIVASSVLAKPKIGFENW